MTGLPLREGSKSSSTETKTASMSTWNMVRERWGMDSSGVESHGHCTAANALLRSKTSAGQTPELTKFYRSASSTRHKSRIPRLIVGSIYKGMPASNLRHFEGTESNPALLELYRKSRAERSEEHTSELQSPCNLVC